MLCALGVWLFNGVADSDSEKEKECLRGGAGSSTSTFLLVCVFLFGQPNHHHTRPACQRSDCNTFLIAFRMICVRIEAYM